MRSLLRLGVVALASTIALVAGTGGAHAATVNSGQPGSACAPNNGGLTFVPPRNGEKTTGLGPDAPAYYEVGAPTGAFAGKAPKGEMIIIHGGSWHLVGKATVAFERRNADAWRARGWETINIDYRACAQSIADVRWFKRRIRTLHPNAPICAFGVSAGAHLALMLAATEDDLACAIAFGGPTDLLAIGTQTAYNPRSGTFTNAGPARVENLAIAAFGAKPNPLSNVNPMNFASQMTARLLLVTGERDPLVPAAQNTALRTAVQRAHSNAYVDVALLPPGGVKFVHTGTTQAALDDLSRRQDALVAPLTGSLLPPVLKLL